MKFSIVAIAAMLVLGSFSASFGQSDHSLQLNAGSAFSTIIGSNPGGIYTLPPNGGTLVTTASGSSYFWSLTGNGLTGPSATAPNEFLGSSNNYDVIFRTANTEKMRLTTNGVLALGTKT